MPMGMTQMRRCVNVYAALAAAVVSSPAWGQGPPATPVVVDAATVVQAEQWREVTGELRAAQRALLATEEEGLVVALERGQVRAADEDEDGDEGGAHVTPPLRRGGPWGRTRWA